MSQKTQEEKDYQTALRTIFQSPEGDLIREQWKKYIVNTPSVEPHITMQLACWRGGGKDVYRDLLQIINQES